MQLVAWLLAALPLVQEQRCLWSFSTFKICLKERLKGAVLMTLLGVSVSADVPGVVFCLAPLYLPGSHWLAPGLQLC